MRPHEKFGTAVVVAGGRQDRLRVDVASTRAESYEYPGALPKVEHAGIRSDLARRDFTINAMAVSLKPETFGDLFDYFGGREDLDAGRIVVLHNLSFIEDPTRILRAIRYESRYGLRMDEHTLNLARACCAMDLVGDLSSARLRDELVSLLDEEKVDFSLRRVEELGVWPSIHGRLRVDARHARARAPRRRAARGARPGGARRRAGGSASSGCCATSTPRRSPPGRCACACGAQDAPVLERALVVGRRLLDRVARGPSEAELYDLAAGEPVEAVLAAMTLDDSGIAADRLARFLDVTRHVRLEIGGADLLEMGFSSGPRLGEVLRSVLHLKLNGVVARRDEELSGRGRDAGARVTDSSLLVRFLIISPLLLVSLVLHELAHGWVAYRLGDPTAKVHGRLTLNPIKHLDLWGTVMLAVTFLGFGRQFFFGWAKPVPVDPRFFKDGQRGMAWVGAAGPLTNFALALVAVGLIWADVHVELLPRPSSSTLLFVLNVILGTLNLIPIPPLDGSRVVGGLHAAGDVQALGGAGPLRQLRLPRAVRGPDRRARGVRRDVRRRARPVQQAPAGRVTVARHGLRVARARRRQLARVGGRRRDRRLPGAGGRRLRAAVRQPQPRPVGGRRAGGRAREPAPPLRRGRAAAGAARGPRPGPRHHARVGR